MNHYFGTYHRFDTTSKKEAALFVGADNIIGDKYEVLIEGDKAWLKNRFGSQIAFFDPDFSRQLHILQARGWKTEALLSMVAYTNQPDPGRYWGEMAVLCYDLNYESAFKKFVDTVSEKLAKGIRPDIDLGEQATKRLIESEGTWFPEQRAAKPSLEANTIIVKDQRQISEKLIEEGRKGNKGCYVASIAFIILVVAFFVFLFLA